MPDLLTRLRLATRTALALGRALPALPAGIRGGVDGVVRHRARQRPHAPMLRTVDRTWTAREVDVATDRAAHFWQQRGVRPGEVVALLMDARPELLVQQLGLARLGAAAALLNIQLRAEPLAHALHASRARFVVTDEACNPAVEALPGGPRSLGIDAVGAAQRRLGDDPFPAPRKEADSVFCHIFTSGTTGLPKAVPIRHTRFLMAGLAIHGWGGWLRPDDVVFTPLPLYHSSAQLVGWSSALGVGACFAFTPRFSASRYWSEALAVEATVGLYVGELCRYLLNAPFHPDERRHRIHTFIGNGLRADVWAPFRTRFGAPRVVEFYGATEGNALMINRTGKVGSCGRPIFSGPFDNLEVIRYDVERALHPRGRLGSLQRCDPGEVGELMGRIGLSPAERFDGYTDADASDAKVLRGGPLRRYFRSGDLLKRDAEGYFYFVDRIGDTFRWKGENVSTQEVAESLVGHGGVVALAVYGVEVPGCEGRAGMAAVVGDLDPAAFHARVMEALPPFAQPAFVRVCRDLDHTSTMKFKKTRLAAEGFDRCGEDQVYVRTQASYELLVPKLHEDLEAGRLRL